MEFKRIQIVTWFLAVCMFEHTVGNGSRRKRLIKGVDAEPGEFPWAVSLQINSEHSCGGTILTEFYILTAAHCFPLRTMESDLRDTRIITGTNDQEFRNASNIFKVEISIVHNGIPGDPLDHDIMILKVDRPIPFNRFRQPAKLPSGPPPIETNATISGWGRGRLDNGTWEFHRFLQKLPMRTMNVDQYRPIYGNDFASNKFCAVGNGKRGTCMGDSGAGLIYNDTVIGIASGTGVDNDVQCGTGLPDIFTDVYYYIEWIATVLNHKF